MLRVCRRVPRNLGWKLLSVLWSVRVASAWTRSGDGIDRCEGSPRELIEHARNSAAGFAAHPGPGSARVALVSQVSENIVSYAGYTAAINRMYADRHGYDFFFDGELPFGSNLEDRDKRWAKVLLLQQAVESGRYDWVVWVDADAVFMQHALGLDPFFQEASPQEHFLACEDVASDRPQVMNSGILLLRSNDWTIRFLREWWDSVAYGAWTDQDGFDILYARNALDIRDHSRIYPSTAFNSEYPFYAGWEEQRPIFVLHLMATLLPTRVRVFKKVWEELCQDGEWRQGASTKTILLQETLQSFHEASAQFFQEGEPSATDTAIVLGERYMNEYQRANTVARLFIVNCFNLGQTMRGSDAVDAYRLAIRAGQHLRCEGCRSTASSAALALAQDQISDGHLESALSSCRLAMELDPTSPEPVECVSDLLSMTGQRDGVVEDRMLLIRTARKVASEASASVAAEVAERKLEAYLEHLHGHARERIR